MREVWQEIGAVVRWLWSPDPVDAVQEFFGPEWGWLFSALTLLGTVYSVAVVASVALWFADRRLTYSLLGVVVLATAVDALLWTLFSVSRPDAPDIVVRAHLGVPSFPSGHTVIATVLWVSVAALSWVPRVVPLLIVPVVMLSRLYLGAHYLGDVLVSVLIGVLLVAIYLRSRPAIMRWFGRRSFWFILVVGLSAPFAVLLFMGTSSRGFELFGAALAIGLGLPLEYRYVRYKSAGAPLRWQAVKGVIGLGGMGLLLLAHGLLSGGAHPISSAALLALAVLWGVLFTPALFVWLSGRTGRGRGP